MAWHAGTYHTLGCASHRCLQTSAPLVRSSLLLCYVVVERTTADATDTLTLRAAVRPLPTTMSLEDRDLETESVQTSQKDLQISSSMEGGATETDTPNNASGASGRIVRATDARFRAWVISAAKKLYFLHQRFLAAAFAAWAIWTFQVGPSREHAETVSLRML